MERQIRQLCLRGVQRICVHVAAESASQVRDLRSDFSRLYRVELEFIHASATSALEQLTLASTDVIVLQGHAVYDDRVLDQVLGGRCETGVCAAGGVIAARLRSPLVRRLLQRGLVFSRAVLEREGVRFMRVGDLDPYVASLRLRMAPVMVRIAEDEDLTPTDHLLYRRTFKGVIDAVARYGYYHLVRWLTRQLCRTSLSPNLFTILSILCIWGAVPLFGMGWPMTAVAVAWMGVILDSVDGKLARLRLQLSDTMGTVEHFAAMPGLGLWYVATGYQLTGGALFSDQPHALLTWGLLVVFLLDKCVTGGFKWVFGKELFDYAPVDAAFHLIAARRNTSLVLLTLGAVTGAMSEAFWCVAAWTGVALVFHSCRFAWISVQHWRRTYQGVSDGGREDCGCRR